MAKAFAVAALVLVGCASAATGGWQPAAPLPEPRTEVAAAYARGEIVVAGGFLASGASSARADAYDPAADRWRRLPDLPLSVDHAAATAANGVVYVVGGYGPDRTPLRDAFALVDGRWLRLPRLPQARAAAGAAIARGKLYVAGGVDEQRRLARRMLVYDLRTRRWSVSAGPAPREHLAVAALGRTVYVLAGRSAGLNTNVSRFEAFDVVTRRWRRLPPIPSPRGGTGAAAVAGRIVSVGGEAPGGTIASVWSYAPAARRWTRLAPLPTPRHGLGVVSVGRRLFAVAGGPQPGLTVSGANEWLQVG